MDEFEVEIKREFINEALINLEEAEGSFLELESASDPKPLLDKIFRLAHNLKGGSRAVGFGDVAEFTHQLENLVLKIQKGEVQATPQVLTTLLRSNDRLVEMLSELKSNLTATFDNSDLLSDIQKWLDGKGQAPAEVEPEPEPVMVETSVESTSSVLEVAPAPEESVAAPSAQAFFDQEELSVAPAPLAAPEPALEPVPEASPKAVSAAPQPSATKKADKPKEKEDEVIRVNLSRIDLLNDYVGEMIVLQSVIQQQVPNNLSVTLNGSLRQMVKLSKDIQALSMSLRMLPVKPLIQKLQRVVRDTSHALSKEVNLEVEGDQLDIDKTVLDQLADPLIHILRNAVDHGLETTEDRVKSGKNSAGRVRLAFSSEGNHLVVEVSDDGKGIDSEVLRRKAIEKRVISEGQSLSEKQLINLIFHPGFSTKSETSEISGRGVGMDVVKTNLEKIGGQIDVTTVVGKGSLFRMQIPLSLAVIEGLVVTSENNRYVVPLNQVQETINLKSQKIFQGKLGIGSCFELRGSVVPLINIEEALGARGSSPIDSSNTGLIINVEEQLMSLVVKDIVRAQQIVIKPLGDGMTERKGWIGCCVLGDGLPTLIVNPVELLEGRFQQNGLDRAAGG